MAFEKTGKTYWVILLASFLMLLIFALGSIVFPPLAYVAVGLMIALFTVVPLILGYIILLDIVKRVKSATLRDPHPGDDATE